MSKLLERYENLKKKLQTRTKKSLDYTGWRLRREINAVSEEHLRRYYEKSGGKPDTQYTVRTMWAHHITVNARSEEEAKYLVMQLPIEAFQMKDLVDYDISDIQRVLSDEEEDAIHIARAEAEKRVFLRYHQLQ